MAVRDDERRAVIRFRFLKGFDGVGIAASHGDAGDVDGAVADGFEREIFFGGALASGGELGDGSARRSLGHLTAGVGVNLRIKHKNFYVVTRAKDVVQATRADIVSPAITADEPHTLADESVGNGEQVCGKGRVNSGKFTLELGDANALRLNANLRGLIRGHYGLNNFLDR